MKGSNKQLEKTWYDQSQQSGTPSVHSISYLQSDSNSQSKSKYFLQYKEQLKKYQMPYTPKQYLDRLHLNGIMYQESKNNLPYKILIKIEHSTCLGTIVKLKVIIGAFTLDIKVININEESYLASKYHGNRGTFGQIYHVRRQQETSAIKCIKLKFSEINWGKNWKQAFIKVIKQYCICKIFSALEIGPKATKIYGYDIVCFRDTIQFSTEICSRNYLFLKQKNLVTTQFYQALKVMHYFHLVHRDIKPDNMMFSQSYHKLVFIDFGTAQYISQNIGQLSATNAAGTVKYMSPDMKNILIGHNIDCKIDLHFNDFYALKIAVKEIQSGQDFKNKKIQLIELQNSGFLVYLISLIELYDTKAIEKYRITIKQYRNQILKFFAENQDEKKFKYQLMQETFFQKQVDEVITCNYNFLPIFQELESIQSSQIILIQKNRSIQLFDLGTFSSITNDLETNKIVVEFLISQLENHYIFPQEGAQEILQTILIHIVKLIEPESLLLKKYEEYYEKQQKITIFYNQNYKIKTLIKAQDKTLKIQMMKKEVLQLIINWQKKNKFTNKISLKRLQLFSLCQNFKNAAMKFVDPFELIDIYFKKVFWNQAQQQFVLDEAFISNLLLGKKITIQQYQLLCAIIEVEQYKGVYSEIEKIQQLITKINSIQYKNMKNKMPFTYLAIIRLLIQFYDHYGQYLLLIKQINKSIQYLDQLPNSIYNQYAKSDFYKYLLYLYKAKENRKKIMEYQNQLSHIQMSIKTKTVDYIKYILPQKQAQQSTFQQSSESKNDNQQNNILEEDLQSNNMKQQNPQDYEEYLLLPFYFISQDPQQIEKLLSISNFTDLANIQYQKIKWDIIDGKTPKQKMALRKLFIEIKSFPKQKLVEKFLKQSLDRMKKSRFFNQKYDAINSFFVHCTSLKNIFMQIPNQILQQFKIVCSSHRYPPHVWFPCYKIFLYLIIQNMKNMENIKFQQKNLYQSIISFRLYEQAAVSLILYRKSYTGLKMAGRIIQSCYGLFLKGYIGSLSNFIDPNPYILMLIKYKKVQQLFLLIKNYIQNFYHCGHIEDLMFIFRFNKQLQKKQLLDKNMEMALFKRIKQSNFQNISEMKTFITFYIRHVLKYFKQLGLNQAKKCIQIAKGLMQNIQKCLSNYILKSYALLALKIYQKEKELMIDQAKGLQNCNLWFLYYSIQQLRSKRKQKHLHRFYFKEKNSRQKYPRFYKEYNYVLFKKKKVQKIEQLDDQQKTDYKIPTFFNNMDHWRRVEVKIYQRKIESYMVNAKSILAMDNSKQQ